MVHIIPGCPGSTAEFWGAKYWKYIRGKSIELGQSSSNIRISQAAPQYFYDYCYVYEWIDKYDISSRDPQTETDWTEPGPKKMRNLESDRGRKFYQFSTNSD